MNAIRLILILFWILDITNMPFMEMFDTTYPVNALVWFPDMDIYHWSKSRRKS